MKVFAYRSTVTNDRSTGYCGVVFANTKSGLFWALDEFCDPYSCEIKEIKSPAGMCFAVNIEEDDTRLDKVEVSSDIMSTLLDEDDQWAPAFTQDYDVTKCGGKRL